jgi:outer membrane lipoprotein SlyB
VPLPRVGGQARLTLRFTDLVLPSGSTVPIHASLIQQGRSKTGRDAATIGGAAAGGAILGNILGKGDRGKASVIGAVIGAIAGTAIASKTPGEEVVIPQGSVVGVRLNDPLEVRARVRP